MSVLCQRVDTCEIRTAIKNEEGTVLFYTCYHKIETAEANLLLLPSTAAKGSETAGQRKEIHLYAIEEAARKKAYATAYDRLRALVQEVDVAGREGVMWADIDCLFAELKGER